MREKNPEEELKEAFRVFDAEGTGVIGQILMMLTNFDNEALQWFEKQIMMITGGVAEVNALMMISDHDDHYNYH